jgi:hypothetical protein
LQFLLLLVVQVEHFPQINVLIWGNHDQVISSTATLEHNISSSSSNIHNNTHDDSFKKKNNTHDDHHVGDIDGDCEAPASSTLL